MAEADFDILSALDALYEEVSYTDFYREIFPSGELEERGVHEKGKYHAVAISIAQGEERAHRYTVTDDLEKLDDLVDTDDFCLMAPISYAGKKRESKNARFLYAMAIDLDGIDSLKRWNVLQKQFVLGKKPFGLPMPTFLVSSGTGLHIYYVLQQPIPLFPNIVKQLEVLKKRLTWQAWTQGASSLTEQVQYESLFQGFRIVGTITKSGGRCRAFRCGEKVTVEYLNQIVPEEYRTTDFAYKSDLHLKDAAKKYPDWYQHRIVEGRPRGTWTCKRALYDWWLRRCGEVKEGHRYWYLMTLATYAVKCGIPRKELERDAYRLVPALDALGDTPFTNDDALHALEAYNDSYVTYPIHTIEVRTGLRIERNKRNGRKQEKHLQGARAIRDINNDNWREGNGRPTAQRTVYWWRMLNPEGSKKKCKDETGLTYPTIRKWWDSIQKGSSITSDELNELIDLIDREKERAYNASRQ